jgi:hypothetical protein
LFRSRARMLWRACFSPSRMQQFGLPFGDLWFRVVWIATFILRRSSRLPEHLDCRVLRCCCPVMFRCFVKFVAWCEVSNALAITKSPVELAEAALARTCGGQCLAFLHTRAVLAPVSANTSSGDALIMDVAGEVGRRLGEASALTAQDVATDVPALPASPAVIACATPASCALKALAANKCNYARVALQHAYNELNVATHVLGVLVSSLCGCLHSGHVSSCAMRSMPQVCGFPYTVYAKAYAGSVQAWEAVKASTKSCVLHGDADLLP